MAIEDIEKVASFSFPSNHLLTFQLVRDLTRTTSIKPEYFFFVTLAPGARVEGENSRTYDFTKTLNLKYAVHEIAGLAFALKNYAMGRGKAINYVKFSKSAGLSKSISLLENVSTQNTKAGPIEIKNIIIRGTCGTISHTLSLTIEQAYSVGEMLELLFRKGAELELNRLANTTTFNSRKSNQGTRPAFNQPEPLPINDEYIPSPPPSPDPFVVTVNEDDNINFLSGAFKPFT